MRKEIIVAILVGIIFGGIFTYGIRRANLAFKPISDNQNQQIQSEDEEETSSNLPDGLSILSPEQNDVFTENEIAVTGITKPNSIIVISSEGEDFVISSDNSGEFTQEIELSAGLNNILISAFSGHETIGEEVFNLVYTTKIDF